MSRASHAAPRSARSPAPRPSAATARSSPARIGTIPTHRRPPGPGHLRARPAGLPTARPSSSPTTSAVGGRRRKVDRGLDPVTATVFDIVWSGRRHVMMGATQIDRYGNQNIACIGPSGQAQGPAARRARRARATPINHPTSYWVPEPLARGSFVAAGRLVSGVGYDRAADARRRGGALPRDPPRRHQPGRVRLRDARPPHAPALGAPRRHRRRGRGRAPASSWSIPDDVPTSRGCPPTRSCALHPRASSTRSGAPARRERAGTAAVTAPGAAHPRSATWSGCDYPIVQTGMGWVAGAAADRRPPRSAGGLGILAVGDDDAATSSRRPSPRSRTRTDRPFGVNLRADAARRRASASTC